MEQSLFWDAEQGADGTLDRTYSSDDFASMWASIWTTGVMPNQKDSLLVEPLESSMSVYVNAGSAFINGRFYQLTEDLKLTLDTASDKTRIDLVSLRFDKPKRQIKLRILKGADDGTMPTYAANDSLYDLILARITIPANAQYLTDSMVEDCRTFSDFSYSLDNIKRNFYKWFNNLNTELEGDVAANLANRIEEVERESRSVIRKDNRIYLKTYDYDESLDGLI